MAGSVPEPRHAGPLAKLGELLLAGNAGQDAAQVKPSPKCRLDPDEAPLPGLRLVGRDRDELGADIRLCEPGDLGGPEPGEVADR